MTTKKPIFRIGIVYAIGQILLQVISFILLSVYSNYLSVPEFGLFSVTATISDLIGFLLVFGIYSGYSRFYMEVSPDLRNKLRNTALAFSISAGAIMSFLIILSEKWIAGLVLGIEDFFPILFYMVLNNFFIQITTIFLCDYFLEYKAGKVVAINLIKAVINILIIFYFLAVKRDGIAGIYKGQMAASLCLLLYFIFINFKSLKLELDKNMLRQMLKFGSGLIPSNLSASVLNYSDRFFMAKYRSYSETGIYSIGYKFGMQIDPIFTTPFRQVFTTYKYENWNDENARYKFNEMFLKYHILGCFLMLCIAVFSRIAISMITRKDYLNTYKIVPIILIAYFLYGETRFFNLGIELKNKTYLDSIILISGGSVNIILNLILIPPMGMAGAALATVLAYIIIIFLYSLVSGRLYRIRYDLKKPLIVFSFTAGLYGLYFVFSLFVTIVPFDLIPGILLPVCYVLLCLISGIIKWEAVKNFCEVLLYGFKKILNKRKADI